MITAQAAALHVQRFRSPGAGTVALHYRVEILRGALEIALLVMNLPDIELRIRRPIRVSVHLDVIDKVFQRQLGPTANLVADRIVV